MLHVLNQTVTYANYITKTGKHRQNLPLKGG